MRTTIACLISLLAGTAFAQQDLKSYAPTPRTDAPTFVNAEVVRVNRDNTATFRSESGEITLTADPGNVRMLGSLHAGDKVLVEYRESRTADGRLTRYVTSVKPASPTSGEPGRTRMVAARLSSGSTLRARVLSFDKKRRRVTVIDESGGLRAIPLRSGLTGLDALVPGANVALSLGAAGAGAVNVSGITSLGTTPVFAGNNAFPAVNGRFVSFNSNTGIVTLDTTTAGRLTFPVSSTVASNFSGLRRGDNLSFGFDVANAQPQLSTAQGGIASTVTPVNGGFTAAPVATITGFQPLTTGAGAAGVSPPVTSNGVGQMGAANGNTVGGMAVPGGTAANVGGGNTVGGMAVNGGVGQPTAANTGATGAATGAGTTGGTVAGGGVTGGGVAGSPFGNPVPSIPAATPVAGVVLPPAGAKEPLSADEVGMNRAQGERDLDAAAMSLAAAAAGIDPVWAGFKNQCLSGFTVNTVTSGREWYLLASDRIPTPNDDACRSMFADLTGRTKGFLSQLETVEDAARKADVLPARVREVLDRHKL